MNPRFQRCESLIGDFKLEMLNNKKIIQRFDEVLLEKASKFSIDIIYQKLQEFVKMDDFKTFKQTLASKEGDRDQEMSDLQDLVEQNYKEIKHSLSGSLSKIAIDVENRILENVKDKCIDRDELNSNL